MKFRKSLAMLLSCVIASGTVVFAAQAAETDVWDGTVDTSWYDASNPQTEYTLTTAEQFAGLAYLVNGAQSYNPAIGNEETADFGYYCGRNASPNADSTAKSVSFENVEINLGVDIDLCAVYANGEQVKLPGNEQLSMMPVGYSKYTPFKGTFDGQGHTIKNLFQGGWDMYGFSDSGDGVYLGLFGVVEDATIKNLAIDNFSCNCEMNIGIVAGLSGGKSEFDGITITNCKVPNGGGWWTGGLIGWAYGNQTIKNIDIDETNTIAQSGGHYDTAVGGLIGGCDNVGGETIAFENCNVACKLDVYNDCTANYVTDVYRNCGMIIGGIGETEEKIIDGVKYPDFEAKGITLENVNVTIGEWANYTYCWSYSLPRNCQRVEPGLGYKGVDVSTIADATIDTNRPFDAIFGAENAGDLSNVRGPVNVDVMEFLDVKGVEVEDLAIEARSVAKIGNKYYKTLEDALAVVADGGTIEIINDVEATAPIAIEDKNITIKGNGKAVTGADDTTPDGYGITPFAIRRSTVNFEDITIEGGDTSVIGADTLGKALDVEESTLSFVNSTLSTGKGTDENVVGMPIIMTDDESDISLKDVTLYQFKSSWAAAAMVSTPDNSGNVTEVGKEISFAGTITVAEGSETLAEVPYKVPEGEAVGFVGSVSDEYVSAKLYVQFEKVDVENGEDTDEDSDLYNIVILGETGYINRLNSADLTFKLTSDAANENASKPVYEIIAVDPVKVTTNADFENRYMFNFDGLTQPDETAKSIVIGQVEISGYGDYVLEVDASIDNNIVNTAKTSNNIVENFYVGGEANGDGELILGKDFDESDALEETASGTIAVPERELTINITFPNAVVDKAADYQDMSVTIVGGDVNETVALGDGTDKDAEYTIVRELPYNATYTVTVSGAGYRTARYSVTLTDDKTLNFWNNVMDNAIEVEEGKETSSVVKNFLAGDIVKDNNINIYDLSAVVSYFGTENCVEEHPEYAKYDLNRDGVIDSKDVAYVLVSWNK